jgi:hypothetical protein
MPRPPPHEIYTNQVRLKEERKKERRGKLLTCVAGVLRVPVNGVEVFGVLPSIGIPRGADSVPVLRHFEPFRYGRTHLLDVLAELLPIPGTPSAKKRREKASG